VVGVARRFVAHTLAEWELHTFVHDAELITSELVSNGVLHARTVLRLRLRSDGLRWLRIEVYDQNSRLPRLAPCPEDATSGRGLALVEGLGSAWGVVRERDGKIVWAELETADHRPDRPPRHHTWDSLV
jgi:hypothetical protein